jgi:hypothetical protein
MVCIECHEVRLYCKCPKSLRELIQFGLINAFKNDPTVVIALHEGWRRAKMIDKINGSLIGEPPVYAPLQSFNQNVVTIIPKPPANIFRVWIVDFFGESIVLKPSSHRERN